MAVSLGESSRLISECNTKFNYRRIFKSYLTLPLGDRHDSGSGSSFVSVSSRSKSSTSMASEKATPPPTTVTNGPAKIEAPPPDKMLSQEHLVLPSRPGPSPQPTSLELVKEAKAIIPPEDDGTGYVAPKFEGKEQQMELSVKINAKLIDFGC